MSTVSTSQVSKTPIAPSTAANATVDNLFQGENFKSNSAAVQKGGHASLINVQKDIDTLVRGFKNNQGPVLTQADVKNDLVATGLSDSDASQDAASLFGAAQSAANGNTGDLQNELASLFKSQGGLDADHAQGLANTFVSMIGTSSDTASYESDAQRQDKANEINASKGPGSAPSTAVADSDTNG